MDNPSKYVRKSDGKVFGVVGIGSRGYRLKSELDDVVTASQEEVDKDFEPYPAPRAQATPVDFQVGDVVILKSGGLQMVVGGINTKPELAMAYCCWMCINASEIKREWLDVRLLARVDDQQLQPVPMGTI